MAQPSVIAIIPARGGSKGIPSKNLQLVGGIPLIARTINAAFQSIYIDQVFVTTDDDLISNVSSSYGAKIIPRPLSISGDLASSESALLHALDYLESRLVLPEILVFLQCTSPFTKGTQIDTILSELSSHKAQSAFAVKAWHGFLWRLDGSGVNHSPYELRRRRQDLDPVFLETGSIYCMKVNAFKVSKTRFCTPCLPVPLDDLALEIDSPHDLKICQAYADSLAD